MGKHYFALTQAFHEAKPGQGIQNKTEQNKKQKGKRITDWAKRMAPHTPKDQYPQYIKNTNKRIRKENPTEHMHIHTIAMNMHVREKEMWTANKHEKMLTLTNYQTYAN